MDIRTGYVPSNEVFIADWGQRNFSNEGLEVPPKDEELSTDNDGLVPCGGANPPCPTNGGSSQGSGLFDISGDSKLSDGAGGNRKTIIYFLIAIAVLFMAYVLYLAFKKNAKK